MRIARRVGVLAHRLRCDRNWWASTPTLRMESFMNRRNIDVVRWLREHNSFVIRPANKVGFYGMDLYSLHGSIGAVLEYLDKIDHAAATRARYRYACFEHFGMDPQAYGYAANFDLDKSCEE